MSLTLAIILYLLSFISSMSGAGIAAVGYIDRNKYVITIGATMAVTGAFFLILAISEIDKYS